MDASHLYQQAMALIQAGRGHAALAPLESAVRMQPGRWEAVYNLARLYADLKRPKEALKTYQRAAKLAPSEARIRLPLARLLARAGKLNDAIAEATKACQLARTSVEARVLRAQLLEDAGRYDQARNAHAQVLELAPDHAESHVELAYLLLRAGRWAEGWDHYEWRWRKASFKDADRHPHLPLWDGAPLKGGRILIHTEQGFGDALQFLRFVPLLAERGMQVVLEVQPGLIRLLEGWGAIHHLIKRGDPLPDVTCRLPLLSLPHRLGIRLDNLPSLTLDPPPDLRRSWADRLRAHDRLRVGVIWAGNPAVARDADRSPGLDVAQALFATQNAHFFGLQVGAGRKDLDNRTLPANFTDLGPQIVDMAETAAIMANLDVVVSSCTGPAHLAGLLGKPLFLMLDAGADWRWMTERTDSPWYPSARLFRQKKAGDWDGVIREIRRAVERLAALRDPIAAEQHIP